jgi:superfamily II DNA helicase RecQ
MSDSFSFKYKFFRIPACGDSILENDLNDFLESHAVLDVCQEFLSTERDAHWCYSIRWRKGGFSESSAKKPRSRIDYREVLDPETFILFAQLRELRKEISTKEGIPTYAVFTNEQLAEIARKRPQEMSKLKEVEGVGESRLQKYGQLFLKQVKDEVQPADQ